MKKQFCKMLMLGAVIVIASSCTSLSKTMREPNVIVELNKADFTLSEQVSAEAEVIKVFGVDWARLFLKKTGDIDRGSASVSFASIPVIGGLAAADKTANYALYELMHKNSDYDVVFYPQYEKKVVNPLLGLPIIKITTVKAKARLGKLKD